MESFKVGQFVNIVDKNGNAGQITYFNAKLAKIECLTNQLRIKNPHLKKTLPSEIFLTGKKIELPLDKLTSNLNVFYFSDFVFRFYNFALSSFESEKIAEQNAFLLRLFY